MKRSRPQDRPAGAEMPAARDSAKFLDIVNFHRRIVILRTGEVVPIVMMFDEEGNQITDPERVRYAIAGPTRSGRWIPLDRATFELRSRIH